MNKLVIHSGIVLLMDEIIVKINDFPFLLGAFSKTRGVPWDPTLRTSGLVTQSHFFLSVIIILIKSALPSLSQA